MCLSEADPFGSGANGSGDEDDDSQSANASFKYLQRGNSIDSVSQQSSSGVSVLPQMSRTISGVEASNAEYNEHEEADGDMEGGYRPPRMQSSSSQSMQPERIHLSPSQFQHGGAAAASSSSSAQKHARKGSAGPFVVDPPSDDDDDKPSLPAQRKRSSVSGAAPGRNEARPLLEEM